MPPSGAASASAPPSPRTPAYDELVTRLKRIGALGEAAGHLAWDQETYMPPGGTEARALELGTLSGLSHELFTSEAFARALKGAEAEVAKLSAGPEAEKKQALLRETRFAFDRATRVPTELVESITRATSRALSVWVKAKKASDYKSFAPILGEIIELKKQYAAKIDPDAAPYAVLFADYEPWIALDDTRRNLARLREGLKPLIARAAARPPPGPSVFEGKWEPAKQMELCQRVLKIVGYDFEHGRLDVSAHPFSTGNPYDARITTRFDPEDPVSSLTGTIHEFGHSLYTLGLPKEDFGTPLGDARDLSVHESQSRLWENHVGRSKEFWEHLLPVMRETFGGAPKGASAEAAWRDVNRVEPSFIRVEADELTYHMHIALRFEIEESIVTGETKLAEIPAAWNERVQKYLGITPPDDARGCLQDVHWSHGSFGYFPTYSLGSMLAAQLFSTFERERGGVGAFAGNVRAGDFAPLRAWLKERVHQHGKRYKTPELVQSATGKALSPDDFLAYAERKFAAVWA